MNITDNSRKAVIALHPTLPGAIAYINAERAETPVGQMVIEDWLEQGLKVAKVTLAEAMEALSRYSAARLLQPPAIEDNVATLIGLNHDEELPAMMRKQAD